VLTPLVWHVTEAVGSTTPESARKAVRAAKSAGLAAVKGAQSADWVSVPTEILTGEVKGATTVHLQVLPCWLLSAFLKGNINPAQGSQTPEVELVTPHWVSEALNQKQPDIAVHVDWVVAAQGCGVGV